MPSNQTLLQKADIALADIKNNGGILMPEQSDTFIRKLLISPTLIRVCRTVVMGAPTRKINKIGFGSRILRPAVSGTALAAADRSKPTTEQIELNTKEVIAEVRIPYDVMEDNIEQAGAANNEASNTGPGGLRNTIISLIAERAAVDMEEMGLLGDTAVAGQGTLSLFDGWLKRASTLGHTVNFQSGEPLADQVISKALFKAGLKAMPDQYLRERAALRHFVSVNQEINYRDSLADRQTGLGDALIQGWNPVFGFGVPVEPVSMMSEGKGLLTHPKNLIMGIQRQISLEYDKDISARVYIIVLTARLDFQIEETDATVYYTGIKAD